MKQPIEIYLKFVYVNINLSNLEFDQKRDTKHTNPTSFSTCIFVNTTYFAYTLHHTQKHQTIHH